MDELAALPGLRHDGLLTPDLVEKPSVLILQLRPFRLQGLGSFRHLHGLLDGDGRMHQCIGL